MTIGENIKRIRKEKGLTQKELGKKLDNISQQQIGQWETGKANPKLKTIMKIAGVLGVSPFEIMTSTEYQSLLKKEAEEEINKNLASRTIRIIPEDEEKLVKNYNQLNDKGKEEALKRVSELTEISKYRKEE